MKKVLPLLIILLTAALIWVGFFWNPSEQGHAISQGSHNLPKGGDFNLKTADGPINLKSFQGKVLLIYFGYTWCPDVCPTNLAMMAGALGQLKDNEKDKVQGLFVSVDPQRDTVERLKEYTAFFHETIIGATTDAKSINEVATRYGSIYRKVQQDSATDYVVDHSSETYVVNPDGELVERLPHGASPEQILTSVRKLL